MNRAWYVPLKPQIPYHWAIISFFASTGTYLFIVFFKTGFGSELLRKVWKTSLADNFYFWGITLMDLHSVAYCARLHAVCCISQLPSCSSTKFQKEFYSLFYFFFDFFYRFWNTVLRWLSSYQTHASWRTSCLTGLLQTGVWLIHPRLHDLCWTQTGRQRFVPGGLRWSFCLWIQRKVLPRGCCIVGKRMCFPREIWRLRKGPLLEAMGRQHNEYILNVCLIVTQK